MGERMLILATGDNHFARGPRWAECLRVHDWIAGEVERRAPDLFLCAGDLYERASTPEERDAAARWLTRIARVCPVVVVRGNHDKAGDVELLGRLDTYHPIVVEERAGVCRIATDSAAGHISVAAFAWPSRAMLAATLGDHATPEAVAQHGRDAMRAMLRGLGEDLRRHGPGPRILLGHAHVVGCRVGLEGQPLAPGAEVTVGLEDLALAGADAVVLGHIHAAQDWTFGGVPVAYTGSPFRNSFGEREEKSILALRFDHPRDGDMMPVAWERIPTPAAPMIAALGEYVPPEVVNPGSEQPGRGCIAWHEAPVWPEEDMRGAEVRLRYMVEAQHRESARGIAGDFRAELLAEGAASVKVEEVVIATTRARAPEVAAARSPFAMLEAHLASKGTPIEDAEREGLRAKVAELEGAAA